MAICPQTLCYQKQSAFQECSSDFQECSSDSKWSNIQADCLYYPSYILFNIGSFENWGHSVTTHLDHSGQTKIFDGL